MAFFRFNRDKRGYEHFFLVEPVTNRRGKTRPRVLYWYRTPPNVRVGRVPFDEEARRALEAQNPNVTFDWRKIIEAPIPSADVERWRERRRAEKAERAARHHAPTASDLDEPVSDAADHDAEADQTQRTQLAATAPPTSGGAEQQRKRRRRRRGRGPRPDATASQVSAAAEPAPPPDEASGD